MAFLPSLSVQSASLDAYCSTLLQQAKKGFVIIFWRVRLQPIVLDFTRYSDAACAIWFSFYNNWSVSHSLPFFIISPSTPDLFTWVFPPPPPPPPPLRIGASLFNQTRWSQLQWNTMLSLTWRIVCPFFCSFAHCRRCFTICIKKPSMSELSVCARMYVL